MGGVPSINRLTCGHAHKLNSTTQKGFHCLCAYEHCIQCATKVCSICMYVHEPSRSCHHRVTQWWQLWPEENSKGATDPWSTSFPTGPATTPHSSPSGPASGRIVGHCQAGWQACKRGCHKRTPDRGCRQTLAYTNDKPNAASGQRMSLWS